MRADRVFKTLLYFNPRSHERSDYFGFLGDVLHVNFNPRSHERSDDSRQQARALSANISIHAPTRGATYKLDGLSYEEAISIHAPTRGATHLYLIRLTAVLFQSTLPREERPTTPRCRSIMPSISIHAPTRGATAILHKKFVYFYTIPTINI